MLHETDFELLNAEIDGTLTPADRAELSRRLLENTELRAVREDLRRACAELERLPAAEPPAGLKEKILAALPASAGAEPQSRRGFATGPRTLRFAAAIVGGVLVSALAFQASRSLVAPGEEQMAGTIASRANNAASSQLRIETAEVNGTVAFTSGTSGLGVRFTPDGAGDGIDVYVERGATVARLQPVDAPQQGEAGVLAAEFPGALAANEALRVRVVASGVPVFEGRWQAPATR